MNIIRMHQRCLLCVVYMKKYCWICIKASIQSKMEFITQSNIVHLSKEERNWKSYDFDDTTRMQKRIVIVWKTRTSNGDAVEANRKGKSTSFRLWCDNLLWAIDQTSTMDTVQIAEKPFKCTECDVRFVTTKNIPRHMKLYHSGNREMKQCWYCKGLYANNSNYKVHWRKSHINEYLLYMGPKEVNVVGKCWNNLTCVKTIH